MIEKWGMSAQNRGFILRLCQQRRPRPSCAYTKNPIRAYVACIEEISTPTPLFWHGSTATNIRLSAVLGRSIFCPVGGMYDPFYFILFFIFFFIYLFIYLFIFCLNIFNSYNRYTVSIYTSMNPCKRDQKKFSD